MAKNQLVVQKNNNLIPQTPDAEDALLGAVLTTPESFIRVSDYLNADDFYKPANKSIYKAIESLTAHNEPIDIVTVSEKLKSQGLLDEVGGRDYVTELALNSITSVNIQYYAKMIKEASTRRNLIVAGSEIVNMAYQADSPDIVLDTAQKLILGISSEVNSSEVKNIESLVFKTYEKIVSRYENPDQMIGVPTGFYDFDQITSGLQPSNLIILAGRPAMGKTALALNIAAHVGLKTDFAVAIFSLEMSDSELMIRLLASESEIDSRRLARGHLQAQDWEKFTDSMNKFSSNSKIFIDDTSGITVADLRAKCRRLKIANPNLGLIVIDYLQLMQSSANAKVGDRNQEISAISRGLKSLAKELEIPIVALSQLSRSNTQRKDPRPMLSDLRDSGAIEQDADIVMFVHRQEYYEQDNPDLKGKAELIISKNRSGPVDTVPLLFQANITKFKNSAKTNVF